jgi:hypothetical protein
VIRGCCIDHLNRQPLPDKWSASTSKDSEKGRETTPQGTSDFFLENRNGVGEGFPLITAGKQASGVTLNPSRKDGAERREIDCRPDSARDQAQKLLGDRVPGRSRTGNTSGRRLNSRPLPENRKGAGVSRFLLVTGEEQGERRHNLQPQEKASCIKNVLAFPCGEPVELAPIRKRNSSDAQLPDPRVALMREYFAKGVD